MTIKSSVLTGAISALFFLILAGCAGEPYPIVKSTPRVVKELAGATVSLE
jgi:hypothetical protein